MALPFDGIDPEHLRLRSVSRSVLHDRSPVPRHTRGEHFLKGPIPLGWLQIAGRLPCKALNVAVALWHLAGVKKSARVALSLSALEPFGLNRFTAARGLKALEGKALVRVDRRQGRKAVVTI